MVQKKILEFHFYCRIFATTNNVFFAKRYKESEKNGAPDRTRTCDLRIRNPLLYPTELQAHSDKDGRGGQTRTGDPSLPKRVRYQLRHTPTNQSSLA